MDVVINNSNDAASVYRNNAPGLRVAVRLKGNAPNTSGIGARIKVGEQSQEMIAGGRYLSCDQAQRCFAPRETIEVTWRNGTHTILSNAQGNALYEIPETGVAHGVKKPENKPTPTFQDVSHLLKHSLPIEPTPEYSPLWSPMIRQPAPTLAWVDVDGDGWEDLCVGTNCFRNDKKGGFIAVAREESVRGPTMELPKEIRERYRGLWRAVAVGDFDGDGRQDYVGGNLGQNTKYESFRKKGIHLYKTDAGWLEVYDDLPLQPLHLVGAALPWIRERFPTTEAYASAGFRQIHAEHLKEMTELDLNWFESTVFLNRGSDFEALPLPFEAQLAPVSAICVADFDGDGKPDLFLAQNLFAVHPETSRFDAGRGLLLLGKGNGHFTAIPGQESGIKIYGEQLAAAACDYDHDGRIDLVVTQTGGQTKLYRNLKR